MLDMIVRWLTSMFDHHNNNHYNDKKRTPTQMYRGDLWRRHPESNRGIRVLQTRALPLGYVAIWSVVSDQWLVVSYC